MWRFGAGDAARFSTETLFALLKLRHYAVNAVRPRFQIKSVPAGCFAVKHMIEVLLIRLMLVDCCAALLSFVASMGASAGSSATPSGKIGYTGLYWCLTSSQTGLKMFTTGTAVEPPHSFIFCPF